MSELPSEVRLRILKQFLFQDFFDAFEYHFEMERPPNPKTPKIKHAFYKWGEDDYDEFMLEIMKCLKPRRYFEGNIIFTELQEVLEMTFVLKGMFKVGYEINKKRKFIVNHGEGKVIGEYNVLFMQPCVHIFKCS